MAAVAYLKCQQNDEVKIFLLMSKTQVAPLKKMSILRLELQACLIAVRLAEFVKKEMEFKCIKVTFWSDSAVALSWIKMESRLLKEFVGNRVAMIQEKTEDSQWHHVSGHNNPADLATKGVDLQELIKPDNTWFSGPSFLQEEKYPRNVLNAEKRSVEAEKRKLKGRCHVQNCEAEEFLKVEFTFLIVSKIEEKSCFPSTTVS